MNELIPNLTTKIFEGKNSNKNLNTCFRDDINRSAGVSGY